MGKNYKKNRRNFIRDCAVMTTGSLLMDKSRFFAFPKAAAENTGPNTIVVNPKPLFDISPYLYMQFMEPLGITDASVEAGWDYDIDDWRRDLIDVVKDLSPDVIRWGGSFCAYYKWREGVGPVEKRPYMYNYRWGGKESNRVGTHEFVDFCRRVGAEPLYCVNFMSEGIQYYRNTSHGENRTGNAKEAADWVSYANDPDNKERKKHGVKQPYSIKLWQIGNETSYGTRSFNKDKAITRTIEFARAMKERDPSIQLIGWGDSGRGGSGFWASDILKRTGEYLNYVAIHMMGQRPKRKDTILNGMEYQKEPERAWEELIEISNYIEPKVTMLKEIIKSYNSNVGIAVTEGHLSLRPHNANPVLYEWLTGVFHARTMNAYQRHGDMVKISTAADFFGTRWTVNAVMMQVPRGISYLMPVGSVMRLFKKCNGEQGLEVKSAPSDLDITASRTGNKIYLHVANMNYRKSTETNFVIEGMTIKGGRVYEIAPENPRMYVSPEQPDVFVPREKVLKGGPVFKWRFPGASVSAVEIDLQE